MIGSGVKKNAIAEEYAEHGFSTVPFPPDLQVEMLRHIEKHIQDLSTPYTDLSRDPMTTLEQLALSVPDEIWSKEMSRAARMFPDSLAKKLHKWADFAVSKPFGKTKSAINAVSTQEVKMNPKLKESSLAIYWRCVRPNKPDAGRPHRDATFWVLEFENGYDPKIPFLFDYIKDSIKIWIPLKGCTPKTTLQIIPCSHKMDIPIAIDQTEYGRRPTLESRWLIQNEDKFISPVELSQNHCILFDMDLVHRGPTHNNSELRISAEFTLIVQ